MNINSISIAVRKNIPGGQWLYLKMYCGLKTADTILVNSIQEMTTEFPNDGSIEKFFFIRYTDPCHHLRIRFYNSTGLDGLLSRINKAIKPYIENKIISKVSVDTYELELERYGVLNIENSESIFFSDSQS